MYVAELTPLKYKLCSTDNNTWFYWFNVYNMMGWTTLRIMYTNSSLFAGSYYAVSQIRGVTQRNKIHQPGPSMARSITTVRQLEQVFEPHRVMFKELKKKKKKQLLSQCLCKRKERHYKILHCFFLGGGVNYLRTFSFSWGSWNITLAKSVGWVYKPGQGRN
jgi:hypothetical protein